MTIVPAAAAGGDHRSPQLAFAALMDHMAEFAPVTASLLGDRRGDHRLDDWSPASISARHRDLRRIAGVLGPAPSAGAVPHAGDHRLVADELLRLHLTLDEQAAPSRDPLLYLDLATTAVSHLLTRTDRDEDDRRPAVAARLRQIPRLMDQACRNLRDIAAPQRHVALQRIPGATDLLGESAVAFAPEASEAGEAAAAAVEEFGVWLAEHPASAEDGWRLGARAWCATLRSMGGDPSDPGRIQKAARAALEPARARAEESAAAVLAGGTRGRRGAALIRAALERCEQDVPAREHLVRTAAEALPAIRSWLADDGVFPLPEPDRLVVRSMPSFQRGVSVASLRPPPPLEPDVPSTFAVSAVPAGLSATGAAAHLRAHNIHTLRSIGIHEGYPGHHVQQAFASQHPSLLRRTLRSPAFVEGWAVYAEQEVVERGYLGGTEAGRCLALITDTMWLRVVAGALVDHGIHVEGWEDGQAHELLTTTAVEDDARADARVGRVKVDAGSLCAYFLGSRQLAELRRDAEAAGGTAFDLRDFHTEVLSHGSPPVSVLREEMRLAPA